MRQEFIDLLEKTMKLFTNIPKKYDRGTILSAVITITSNEQQLKNFLDFFKSLRKKFELLGSDEIKAELISSYTWILAVHTYFVLQEQGNKSEEQMRRERYTEKYLSKTIRLAHKDK
jgi:hypothetical protein